jgi:integrase
LDFGNLLKAVGLHRPGVGFYALRHTFRTVADGSRDQPAVNHVMGHAPAANDMASVYREGIDDARLVAVAEHVRAWLFGDQASK